jgi:hypothetical protein
LKRSRRAAGAAIGLSFAFVLAAVGRPAHAEAEPATPKVALLVHAPAPRLADELRQELESSRFGVLMLPAPARAADQDTQADYLLRAPPEGAFTPEPLLAAVAVDARQVVIFVREDTGRLTPSLLRAPSADRPARRRICLAVVERLRQLQAHGRTPMAAPAVARATPDAASRAAAVLTGPAPPAMPAPEPRRLWFFGVTSDLNVLSARGTPTAHVALTAERALVGPLSLTARAAWPVLGAQFLDEGRSVRTWTFAGQLGTELGLRDKTARLRPIIGAAVGLRTALTDTDEAELRTSRVVLTPALAFAASAGLRWRLFPRVDLLFETELSAGLLLFVDRRPYESAAARERMLRISLGVLFEY